MINYDSILSVFDGKPTLLQWLKLVKKALDESVLKDITLKQDGANAVFTFNFEDGTSISTPAVTLPKGDTGAKGAKGDKGEQGVSVTGVDEVSNEVVGAQTLTTLRFNFSNGTNNEVVVHAENGKNGGKLYRHELRIVNFATNYSAEVAIYSSKNAIITNYNEFISYAPLYLKVVDDSTANMFEGTVHISVNGDMSGFLLSYPTATNISAAEPINGYSIETPFETLFTTNDNEYTDTVTEL